MDEPMKTAPTVPITDRPESTATRRRTPRWLRVIAPAIGLSVLVVVALGVYWSVQPAPFDVEAVALARVGEDAPARLVPGSLTVAAVGQVARTLLEKPGGYLYNDVFFPGSFVDNMPSWEYGVIKEVRDSLHAIRNDFSRSKTQSRENENLRQAVEFLNYNVDSWVLPSSESEFRKGIEALDRYFDALVASDDQSARFYVRADNLAAYLAVVEKRLGSFAQRLSASVGDSELTAALVGPSEEAAANTSAPTRVGTPWLEIDNVFYEARGYAWALLHTFKALAVDFEPVLRDKNAVPTMQQVIYDLEEATKRMWSPVVLNGHGFGLIVNHSLVLASYISRANAAVLDLRILLQQG